MPTASLPGLSVRKLADRSDGERVEVSHPLTGERKLVRPESIQELRSSATENGETFDWESAWPNIEHESWPSAGVSIYGELLDKCSAPTSLIARGIAEGWVEAEGEELVHEPAGPPSNPWSRTNTFLHYDAIIIKTVDGDVRYQVTHQPGHYDDPPPDEPSGSKYADSDPSGQRVDWFYELERVA